MKNTKDSLVIGCMEVIDLPEFGMNGIIAKIDTGAFSGALHCEDIRVIKHEGEKILKFRPGDKKHKIFETKDFHTRSVRSSSGHRTKRYIIPIKIALKGKTYDTYIGLSDRKDLKRPVLIGRSFLRQNKIIVDVAINAEMDNEQEITL